MMIHLVETIYVLIGLIKNGFNSYINDRLKKTLNGDPSCEFSCKKLGS